MKSFAPRSFRCAFRYPLAVLALLALYGDGTASAQILGPGGVCATSRAQEDLERVHAAMYAWYLDVVSGIAAVAAVAPVAPSPPASLVARRAAGGAPLCPGSPPVDVTQVPPISVEDLRELLIPQYIAAIPTLDPWERPYDYRLNLPEMLSFPVIALRSSGADGLFEEPTYEMGTTSGPADDLVIFNTTWVREPPRLDPVSRQEVTVERIDRLGAAMLSYWTDIISGAQRTPAGGPAVDLSLITPIAAVDLAGLLQTPLVYTLCVPGEDGWGGHFDLRMNDNPLLVPFMSIRSPGRDGLLEGAVYDTEIFPADDLDRDLVWADGQDYRSPTPTRSEIFTDNFESATLWGTWSCGPGY